MLGATPLFSVSWDNHTGLARVEWSPGSVCGLNEALAVDRAIEALGQGPVRILVDLRTMHSIDRPARESFTDNPHYTAVALLAGSATTRMIANFFLRMNRGSTPARMFSVETDAVTWLCRQA